MSNILKFGDLCTIINYHWLGYVIYLYDIKISAGDPIKEYNCTRVYSLRRKRVNTQRDIVLGRVTCL